MKKIKNKEISFLKFVKILYQNLDLNGSLEDLLITECTITGIPHGYELFTYHEKICTHFVGFKIGKNVHVNFNNFKFL